MPDILDGDPRFRDRDRYRRFVAAMCYGSEDETPTFDRAVAAIRRLARLLDRAPRSAGREAALRHPRSVPFRA